MKKYIKLMRIHHYMKNLLVFAALACSGQFFYLKKLGLGFLSFLAFCTISSVIYIVNDIRDKDYDKNHPTKCNRPIASGAVTVKNAVILAVILFLIAAVCNYFICDAIATGLLILYFVLNIAYSFGLKNIPIVDVTILSAGFLIRIMYGAFATGISVSNWLYLTVVSIAFYFSLGKRRNELKKLGEHDTRKVLKEYSLGFLDKSMSICLTLAIAFYALWSMDSKTESLYNSRYLVLTVPIVLLITMKYNLNIEGDSDGDPVEVLIHDKVLLTLCLLYFAVMFCVLYL